MSTHVDDLNSDVQRIAKYFALADPKEITIPLNDIPTRALSLSFTEGVKFYIVGHNYYPECPPFVLCSWGEGIVGEALELQWDRSVNPKERLQKALDRYIFGKAPFEVCYGSTVRNSQPNEANMACIGTRRFLRERKAARASDWRERLTAPILQVMAGSVAMIVGIGSVGSVVGEQLVRTGIRKIIAIDPDTVEDANLSRTIYKASDCGRYKVDAFADRIAEVGLETTVECYNTRIEEIEAERLRLLVRESTIIISACDDYRTQLRLSRISQYTKQPIVFIGLHKGARTGEVTMVIPGITRCFHCWKQDTRRGNIIPTESIPTTDYGTGQLSGEIALGCDIHTVTLASARIIIGILMVAGRKYETPEAGYVLEAIRQTKTLSLYSMVPDSFISKRLSSTEGQYAMQSVWVEGTPTHSCPNCGSGTEGEDPFLSLRDGTDIEAIRRAIGQ